MDGSPTPIAVSLDASTPAADLPRFRLFLRSLAIFFVVLAALLSVLTTVAWATGFHLLASAGARYIPMAPSTALGFALMAVPLLALLIQPKARLSRLMGIAGGLLVLLLAGAKVVEFFSGLSFGIEELMIRNPEMFGRVPTGRMSPITAGNFLLGGLALLSLGLQKWHWGGGVAAMGELAVTITLLIGYLYGEPLLYGGSVIPVALTTAIAFFYVGVGLFGAAGPENWPIKPMMAQSARGLLLRTFIPATVALVLFFGALQNVFLTQFDIHPAVLSAFSAVIFAGVMTMVVSQVSLIVGARIDRAEHARDRAQKELRKLNVELEERVKERTAQLRERNAQMEDDLKMAREMQLAMLPQQFPRLPSMATERDSAVHFFSFYYPAGGVSGDFFLVVPVSETSVGIFICDVMGHGVRAALVTAMMRALVEELSSLGNDPGALLGHMNKGLQSIFKQTDTTMFATCFYAVADVGHSEIRYASGGHPSPLHLRMARGDVTRVAPVGRIGPALGLFPDATYETASLEVAPGDMLMLFTDGLFEAENAEGEQFGIERMEQALQSKLFLEPNLLLKELLESVRDFSGDQNFEDDVCLLGLQIRPVEEHAQVV